MYRDINMDNTTILPIYHKCDVCNYTSILKANYDRHMLTKKHLKNVEKYNEKIAKAKNTDKLSMRKFLCRYLPVCNEK